MRSWFRELPLQQGETFESLPLSDQVDVACDLFERRWLAEEPLPVEFFLEGLGTTIQARFLTELLPLELEYRFARGDEISCEEVLARFPLHRLTVARTICLDETIRDRMRPAITQVGDYWLLYPVGQGSYGVVYRAYDAILDRFVAVKKANRQVIEDKTLYRQFLREGRNVGRLQHQGIVSVFGVAETADGPYIVSEFVEGGSLTEFIKTGPRPDDRSVAALVADVAEAVDAAHQAGVIHRDLKPANIMLERRGVTCIPVAPWALAETRPRILDFGLARCQDREMTAISSSATVGTIAYMAPEQARRQLVDARSDIYSVGVVLYELLTGERLYAGDSYTQIMNDLLGQSDTKWQSLPAIANHDLRAICSKCLAPIPSWRYQSAADLATDLRSWLAGKPIRARNVSRLEVAYLWCLRNKALAAALCCAAALAIAALISSGVSGRRSELLALRDAVSRLTESEEEAFLVEAARFRELYLRYPVLAESFFRHPDAGEPNLLRLITSAFPVRPIDPAILTRDLATCPAGEVALHVRLLVAQGFSDFEPIWAALEQNLDDPEYNILPLTALLAAGDAENPRWTDLAPRIVSDLSGIHDLPTMDVWGAQLVPILAHLTPHVEQAFAGRQDLRQVPAEPQPALFELAARATATDFARLTRLWELAAYTEERRVLAEQTKKIPGMTEFLSTAVRDGMTRANTWREEIEASLDERDTIQQFVDLSAHQLTVTRRILGLLILDSTDGEAWQAFRHERKDPTLQSYLVIEGNCLPPQVVAERLMDALDADTRYTLLLLMGTYDDLPKSLQTQLSEWLEAIYRTDPDPGIHAASGWVLRRHGYDVRALDAELAQTHSTIVSERRWFYNPLGQCMAIVPESELRFVMGKIGSHPPNGMRLSREVAIRNAFAIAMMPLSEQEFEIASSGDRPERQTYERGCKLFTPAVSADFFRGLNAASGLPNPYEGTRDGNVRIDLSVPGYRLSSSSEWECAARAGTVSDRYYGLLTYRQKRVGPFGQNVAESLEGPSDIGRSIPNRWGLFGLFDAGPELTVTSTELIAPNNETLDLVSYTVSANDLSIKVRGRCNNLFHENSSSGQVEIRQFAFYADRQEEPSFHSLGARIVLPIYLH